MKAVCLMILCTLVGASMSPLLALELLRSLPAQKCIDESRPYLDATCIDLKKDKHADTLSCFAETATSLLGCVKSALHFVRRHPLKAMVMILALQPSETSLWIPGTSATLIVSGLNETRVYDSSQSIPEVLVPINFADVDVTYKPAFAYNATITLNDKDAGNLTSNGTGSSQTFKNGVWNAYGNRTILTPLLNNLRLKITPGLVKSMNLTAEVTSLSKPNDTVKGTIQIVPCSVGQIFPKGVAVPLGVLLKAFDVTPALSNPATVLHELNKLGSVMRITDIFFYNIENCILDEYDNVSIVVGKTPEEITAQFLRSNYISNQPTGIDGVFVEESIAAALAANDSRLYLVSNVVVLLGDNFKKCCQVSLECCESYGAIRQQIGKIDPTSSTFWTATPSMAHLGNSQMQSTRSISESSAVHLVVPASQPPYYIIGGVATGGVCLGGIAMVGVAIKRGWCSTRKKSTNDENLQESPPNKPIQNQYEKLVLAPEGYQDVTKFAVPSHYANALPQAPSYESTFSTLHKAAQEGACDLIALHLDLGVQVDGLNDDGFRPLHLSAREGHLEACKFLIARGAHKALSDKDNKTASQLAQERGHNNVASFLENSSSYQDLPVSS